MDHKEVRQLMEDHLKNKGITVYKISTIGGSAKSTFWVVDVVINNSEYWKYVIDDTRKIILDRRDGSGKHERIDTTLPDLKVTVQSGAELNFRLREPLTVSGKKVNMDDVKLNFLNSNTLIGFVIATKDDTIEELELAYQKARRLTNFLSLKTGKLIDHDFPELNVTKDGKLTRNKVLTVDTILSNTINLDLINPNLQNLVNSEDPELTQQLSDATSGFQAFDDKNYKDAIRNFWNVFEKEPISLPKDYKALRNGISHSELNNSNTISALKNDFDIDCKEKSSSTETPKGVYVDTNESKVRQILKTEATLLKNEVINFLNSKIHC